MKLSNFELIDLWGEIKERYGHENEYGELELLRHRVAVTPARNVASLRCKLAVARDMLESGCRTDDLDLKIIAGCVDDIDAMSSLSC